MRRLFETLERLDGSSVNVLVGGESGTAKEVVARALHEGSGRRGPLVSFNCGALARDLVNTKLFGHKRGKLRAGRRSVGIARVLGSVRFRRATDGT